MKPFPIIFIFGKYVSACSHNKSAILRKRLDNWCINKQTLLYAKEHKNLVEKHDFFKHTHKIKRSDFSSLGFRFSGYSPQNGIIGSSPWDIELFGL